MVISVAAALLLLAQDPRGDPSSAAALEHGYGPLAGQVLDLHRPVRDGFATVVFIYGGGWHSGSGKSATPLAERLVARGFGCALLSHRLYPPDRWPAMIEDVALAFAWVHEHVREQGGDPERLLLMGHSSGAQLALLLASDPRWLEPHGLTPANVLGVVGLSPPLDLEPRGNGKGYGDVLMAGRGAEVFGRDVAVMRGASPLRHLGPGLRPTLLVVGERDFPMLADDARDYVGAAGDLERDVGLLLAPGRDHMGVVQSLLEDHDPTAQAVFAFLDHLAAAGSKGPEEAAHGASAGD